MGGLDFAYNCMGAVLVTILLFVAETKGDTAHPNLQRDWPVRHHHIPRGMLALVRRHAGVQHRSSKRSAGRVVVN